MAAAASQDYLYNLAGQRIAAIRTEYTAGYFNYANYTLVDPTVQEKRDNYDYDGAGRIVAAGTSKEVLGSERGPQTKVVDLGGKTVGRGYLRGRTASLSCFAILAFTRSTSGPCASLS